MESAIIRTSPTGRPWERVGPFILTAHHVEPYPAGNGRQGLVLPASGREPWNMYYGQEVPGFPAHPHQGFETITFVLRGLVDHSDSLGIAARFGEGDVQWLTAGSGIQHAEMFPLVNVESDNPLELFQIWLDLAFEDKQADPDLRMLWAEQLPHSSGEGFDVTIIAGALDGAAALAPPPRSWASAPTNDVAIWYIELESETQWTLPRTNASDAARALFVVDGNGLSIEATEFAAGSRIDLRPDVPTVLTTGDQPIRAVLLQGRPIGRPTAAGGPLTPGGQSRRWPWPTVSPTHGADPARFIRTPDGTVDGPHSAKP